MTQVFGDKILIANINKFHWITWDHLEAFSDLIIGNKKSYDEAENL